MLNPNTLPGVGDAPYIPSGHPLDPATDEDASLEAHAERVRAQRLSDPLSGREIDEALGAVIAAMDYPELTQMAFAFRDGDAAFGRFLRPKVQGYWDAWCREVARQERAALEREARQ